MFSDMGLRSRMNRMGHPFDWGVRKRRGSTGHTEPQPNAYEQYFPDETDFAGFGSPHWDTFNAARKRNQHPTADRSGFFDYLPPEFRQYIPESFGFSGMRHNPQMADRSPASAAFQKPPHPHNSQQQQPQQYANQQQQPQQYAPQQQQHHPQQQYHPQQQQQQNYQQQTVPTSPKPNLCDAAIQTEDIDQPQTQSNNLKQHGLRNTVDLGQKSQQEEIRTEGRAHSAPPREDLLAQQKNIYPSTDNQHNIAQDTFGAANNSAYSNTGTSMTPQCNVQQPQFNAALYQQQRQNQEQQNQKAPHQKHPEQNSQQSSQIPAARSVPIFVEGREVPIVNKINIPQETSRQSQPNQSNQQSQRQDSQPQPTSKTQNRPAPFTAKENLPQQTNEQSQIPPQTPHTTDCINKIQDIQRDVLDLMGKVERFGGLKGDKEYMYLDEMLTRNLLKLDTIDTNGKESIRLARKEAIKCIQASIAVMDAKSEINARPKENQNEKPVDAAATSDGDGSSKDNVTEVSQDPTKTVPEETVDTPKHVSEIQIHLSGEALNQTETPEIENVEEKTVNENEGSASKEQ